MQQSVVSAEAEERMAWDAVQMAKAEKRRVVSRMMNEATMSSWEAWQARVRAADRAVDRAVRVAMEAAKASCRARYSEAA